MQRILILPVAALLVLPAVGCGKVQARAEYFYARALARQRKGNGKGTLEDCAEALREEPTHTKARTLRAYALLAASDVDAALAEYSAAFRLKASDPGGPLGRAGAYYRLERWKEAEEDLKTARKLNQGQNSNVEEKATIAALTSLLHLRAGRKPAAAEEAKSLRPLYKELQKDPAKNHLLTLPLYLAGEMTEADLLQAAGAATARKSQALCEAQFFIGERKILEGDKAGARKSFRACVDTGAQGLFEHDLARIRLIVLGE